MADTGLLPSSPAESEMQVPVFVSTSTAATSTSTAPAAAVPRAPSDMDMFLSEFMTPSLDDQFGATTTSFEDLLSEILGPSGSGSEPPVPLSTDRVAASSRSHASVSTAHAQGASFRPIAPLGTTRGRAALSRHQATSGIGSARAAASTLDAPSGTLTTQAAPPRSEPPSALTATELAVPDTSAPSSATAPATKPSSRRKKRNAPEGAADTLCKWLRTGYCARGRGCWYSHDFPDDEDAPLNSLSATSSTHQNTGQGSSVHPSAQDVVAMEASSSTSAVATHGAISTVQANAEAPSKPRSVGSETNQHNVGGVPCASTELGGIAGSTTHSPIGEASAAASGSFKHGSGPASAVQSRVDQSGEEPEVCLMCQNPLPEVAAMSPVCDHFACVPCWTTWRKSKGRKEKKSNVATNVHQCVLCREVCWYIIPTRERLRTGPEKDAFIANWLQEHSRTTCRHFQRTLRKTRAKYKLDRPDCPFGDQCQFAHELDPGSGIRQALGYNIVSAPRLKNNERKHGYNSYKVVVGPSSFSKGIDAEAGDGAPQETIPAQVEASAGTTATAAGDASVDTEPTGTDVPAADRLAGGDDGIWALTTLDSATDSTVTAAGNASVDPGPTETDIPAGDRLTIGDDGFWRLTTLESTNNSSADGVGTESATQAPTPMDVDAPGSIATTAAITDAQLSPSAQGAQDPDIIVGTATPPATASSPHNRPTAAPAAERTDYSQVMPDCFLSRELAKYHRAYMEGAISFDRAKALLHAAIFRASTRAVPRDLWSTQLGVVSTTLYAHLEQAGRMIPDAATRRRRLLQAAYLGEDIPQGSLGPNTVPDVPVARRKGRNLRRTRITHAAGHAQPRETTTVIDGGPAITALIEFAALELGDPLLWVPRILRIPTRQASDAAIDEDHGPKATCPPSNVTVMTQAVQVALTFVPRPVRIASHFGVPVNLSAPPVPAPLPPHIGSSAIQRWIEGLPPRVQRYLAARRPEYRPPDTENADPGPNQRNNNVREESFVKPVCFLWVSHLAEKFIRRHGSISARPGDAVWSSGHLAAHVKKFMALCKPLGNQHERGLTHRNSPTRQRVAVALVPPLRLYGDAS
ncbi:Predicted E3 ubiquitin ligase [Ceraceosorus bombacis]|uniref:Predicted E3 ubiquitin ligase n=1 Tax=Ceraceosorus bombacis TaxID=401625 RepID=A0A0P1BLA7_9BASI|nr:Predicted E3 ubiquitin ligase [Ceraceosorus bombacis]